MVVVIVDTLDDDVGGAWVGVGVVNDPTMVVGTNGLYVDVVMTVERDTYNYHISIILLSYTQEHGIMRDNDFHPNFKKTRDFFSEIIIFSGKELVNKRILPHCVSLPFS